MARAYDIVYRGYDPVEVELIEAQLRAAAVPYVRLGRGNAAMLGVGNYIVEQLIEVAAEHVDEARALVAAARADDDDRDDADLDDSGVDHAPAGLGTRWSLSNAVQHLTAFGLLLVIALVCAVVFQATFCDGPR
jgi:hypothetical protein